MEWIEISICYPRQSPGRVSTLAVEWIEIQIIEKRHIFDSVSTLAVEWIEIAKPREDRSNKASPPSRWSGLKSDVIIMENVEEIRLHPRGGVD